MSYSAKEQTELYDELYSRSDKAASYDEHLDETFFLVMNDTYFFPALLNSKLAGKTVLDIGCGGGNIGRTICQQGSNFLNLDISFNALTHARTRIYDSGASFLQGDMERIPLKDFSVDVITCYCALHHIDMVGNVAKEIFRVLRTGGTFICLEPSERYSWSEFWTDLLHLPERARIWSKDSHRSLQRTFARKDGSLKALEGLSHKANHKHFFKTPSQFASLFKAAGFTRVATRTVMLEFLPPRFYSSRSKLLVRLLFKISDLMNRLGIARDKGRFIMLHAHKG